MAAVVNVTVVPSSRPDDAVGNPHHILKNGAIKGFRNTYPSWSDSIAGPFGALKNIFW